VNTQELQLSQALERIWNWFQVNAPVMLTFLQPGLTYGHIDAQQDLPFRVPEEVYQLYQWHNGSSAEQYIEFLPHYRFLSLEDGIAQYQMTVEIWRDVSETENHDGWGWFEGWFPLFAEDANFYIVEVQSQPKTTAPIIHFSEYGEHKLTFNSLTDMMVAIAECLETDAYFSPQAEYGDIYFYLDVAYTRKAQIWLKYQPQRVANIEAVLNRQAEDLSPEARQQTYYDLVAIQHPQALSFLVEAIKNADLTDSNLRFQIINLIGCIKNPQAVQSLLNLLQSGDWNTQNIAIKALVRALPDKELIQELQEPQVVDIVRQLQLKTFGDIQGDIATLLERLGSWLPPPLLKLQDSSSSDLEKRWALVEFIENYEIPSPVDPLFELVQQDKDPAIRLAIAKALLALKDGRAREILVQLAQANIPIISESAQEELS
jgi:cell wall assembly regulator SMI1